MTKDTTYIRPADVHAPKRHWSLVHVLFDGGQDSPRNPSPSSLAIGRWYNRPVLAMRWNGNEDNPLGNPQSRGLPTWFVVPEQHWKQILETEHYRLSDDLINFARNFLESKRVYFLNHCPNPECRDYRKLVLHEYRMDELGTILEKLERDELKFYHIICDGWWEPSQQEKADLSAILKTGQRLRFETKVSARLREDGMMEYSQKGVGRSPVSDQLDRPEKLPGYLMGLGASDDQINTFEKQLAESGYAEMWIRRRTANLFAG
jgi:hypothetical protein